jgi:glycosyltransferase involved in cell wall biosynthesis
MRILIITNHYLSGNSGGSVASLGFVNLFPEIYNDCALIFPDNGEVVDSNLHPGIKKIPCPDKRQKWLKGIEVYFGVLHRFRSLSLKNIAEFRPGMIVFDTSIVSHGTIKAAIRTGAKIITIHHNVERDYFKANKPPLLIRLPKKINIRIAEKRSVVLSDLNLTLTDEDLVRLTALYGRNRNLNIETLGVCEPYSPGKPIDSTAKEKEEGKISISVTGSLGYSQSNESLVRFINNYFPLLEKTEIKTDIVIAGSNPSPELKRLCTGRKGLRLFPNHPNLQQVILESDVYLCPVDTGSGLKLRVMDALRLGIPVLAHDVSVRGYDKFVKAGYIMKYSDRESFIDGLRKLYYCRTDSDGIKNMFDEQFSFKSGVTRLKKLLSRLQG